MEFFIEYGLFFAKVFTVVIAIIIVIAAIVAQNAKAKPSAGIDGSITVTHINEQFDDFENSLQQAVLNDEDFKTLAKKLKKEEKAKAKAEKDAQRSRVFLINFDGDVKASAVESLRLEITAILTIARSTDEVVINIESPGGMVHTYGLAASQLQRIRDANIPLTVCVDKVAASGGYLMACVANKIIAAPFAIIGSIGVLAQIPNFNRTLKRFDVDYEVMTAGEHKAPITMFGEITDKGRGKLKEELEDTHVLFKDFITDHRPEVNIDEVATGEVWYGKRAIAHNLIDEIKTSDSYLLEQRNEQDIYLVSFEEKKSLQERLGFAVQHGVQAATEAVNNRNQRASVGKDFS